MNDTIELFNLGEIYVSDFLDKNESPRNPPVEMKLILDKNSSLVRLSKIAPFDVMYGKYWYKSGINNSMKKELKNIVDSILEIKNFQENDLWLDIASNDGTLLSFVPNTFKKLGIDPIEDSSYIEAQRHSDEIIKDYFTLNSFNKSKFKNKKAKVITSIAMFYDIENPKLFIEDIKHVLDDDGIWVLQLSYTPLMLKQLAFDNICHEHIYYYSLFNIKNMLNSCGFQIVDVQLNDTNGGSFRIYVTKNNFDMSLFFTQPYRDVCKFRIDSLLEYEKTLKLDDPNTWMNFFIRINNLKQKLTSFLKEQKSQGKKIWAYGASTKGNTLLQYFGIDNSLVDGIAERNPEKYGKFTIGTNIPIFSEDEMRKNNPDYILILPWHFINEFQKREKEYLQGGGKFIVPCPEFKIIGSI